ncbi:MAG: conjugal transfer protein TraF [Elusimicrobia bacterium]|nr:conjugal transfer protein TraF [Elusimicrobiota bacterium]
MMERTSLVFVLSLLSAQAGYATEWHVLGARAMGMGGAGVAVSEGPIGAYWNPASLGRQESPSGVQIPADVHAELTGQFLEGANDVHDIANACQTTGPNVGLCTQPNIDSALTKLNDPSNGLRADAAAGAHVKIKRLAVFVNNLGYMAGVPQVDLANATPANLQAGLNTSKVVLRGLDVTEIGAGYGRELPWLPGLYVGADAKLLVGKAGYYNIFLNQNAPSSLSKFMNDAKTSVQPGLDLGALWDVRRTLDFVPFRPRVGITARNINNPQFANPAQATAAGVAGHYSLHGNARLGASLSPLSWWHLAMDADLTRNLTTVSGVASQYVGVGTEINLGNSQRFNFPLRAGLARNMAEKGAKTSITGGFGVHLLHAMLDVSAMVSPASVQIKSARETQKIPSNLSVAVQFGALFGGGKDAGKGGKED